MKSFERTVLLAFALASGVSALAQDQDAAPASPTTAPSGNVLAPTQQVGLAANFGRLVAGPYQLEGAITASPAPGTTWNRLLGCARAWGYFWVSGGSGPTLGNYSIHQFSLTGTYIQSFVQDVTNGGATQWGARDLAVDEANFKLWGGMENNRLKEYTFNPGGGPNGTLTYTTDYSIPGGLGTIRALARNPNNGHFFAKTFNSIMIEFTIAPLALVNTFSGNGKASYGMAWDTLNDTLWQFDQNSPVGGTADLVEFNECDVTGVLTGRTFQGTLYAPPTATNIAGGCDIFDDGSGFLKILALHQNTIDELDVYRLDATTPPPTTYCTGGTTTNGCVATMGFSGTPSAAASSGFSLVCTNVEGLKSGIQFYGINGQFIQPWAVGSTSFLCIKTPTQRMITMSTGGTSGLCDGSVTTDFLAFIAANPTALGAPLSAGQVIDAQTWFRDPPAPKTTNLSNGLEFTMAP